MMSEEKINEIIYFSVGSLDIFKKSELLSMRALKCWNWNPRNESFK